MAEQKTELDLILDVAEKLYVMYGIKSVSMDDISREAGMSKKTLYIHVEDKKDLVHRTFSRYLQREESCAETMMCETDDPIRQLLEVSSKMSSNFKSLNPTLLIDLKKHYPASWKLMDEHRMQFVHGQILSNLKEGIDKGWYRSNFDIDFVSRMYVSMINNIMDPNLFPQPEFPFYKLARGLAHYHLYSIVSEKGRKHLEEIINEYQNQ